jgi:hypothetical protein
MALSIRPASFAQPLRRWPGYFAGGLGAVLM